MRRVLLVAAVSAAARACAGPAFTNPLHRSGPDPYMTWYNGSFSLVRNDGSATFAADATFRLVA